MATSDDNLSQRFSVTSGLKNTSIFKQAFITKTTTDPWMFPLGVFHRGRSLFPEGLANFIYIFPNQQRQFVYFWPANYFSWPTGCNYLPSPIHSTVFITSQFNYIQRRQVDKLMADSNWLVNEEKADPFVDLPLLNVRGEGKKRINGFSFTVR